jgi:hypothetical protein
VGPALCHISSQSPGEPHKVSLWDVVPHVTLTGIVMCDDGDDMVSVMAGGAKYFMFLAPTVQYRTI